jgi:oxalate decarboxylase/phosphoglucose isomerase-like protein (cupin superfamily)
VKNLVAFALLVTLASPFSARAQGPDFSGTWKMDPTRSESAAQKDPIGPVTIVIEQTRNDLRMETTRIEGTSVVTYTLDGSEVQIPGGTAKTHWDGPRLVTEIERYVQGQAVTTKETRTLTAGGNEMVVDVTVVVQHGYSASTTNYGKGKDTYVRSR